MSNHSILYIHKRLVRNERSLFLKEFTKRPLSQLFDRRKLIMKKLMGKAIIFIVFILVIAGCSSLNSGKPNTEKENVDGQVVKNEEDSVEETSDEQEQQEEVEAEEESNDINQVIVDDENMKISLLKIVRKSDDTFGDRINVVFEMENKMDRSITVGAEHVSSDGKMVDNSVYLMYQEISPNKLADAELSFMEMDDKEIPALEKDLELTIRVLDFDDYDFGPLEYPVEISFE